MWRVVCGVVCGLGVAAAMAGCGERSSDLPENVEGHCRYLNPFSEFDECTEYRGVDWTTSDMQANCDDSEGTFIDGQACPEKINLGACVFDGGTQKVRRSIVVSADDTACASAKQGCELFGGGAWVPSEPCGGEVVSYGVPTGEVFQQPVLVCEEPLEGEEPGTGPDGTVCTWNAISGCTEPGRKYADYASCEPVLTQRPYLPVGARQVEQPDPRLEDPEYAAELDWVKEQIEACACVCCHSSELTPNNQPSNWYIEAPGNFVDSFFDSGVAFAADLTDSRALGAYSSEDNNGFDRTRSPIPSTDPDRMLAFWRGELEHRGRSADEWPNYPSAVPVLSVQLDYEPDACPSGIGVGRDGTLNWEGGPARYFYVLSDASESPGVPPNLDKPAATLWRLDVEQTSDPFPSGSIRYGEAPEGTFQNIPAEGAAPPPLVEGETYYLYVQADVIIPITRCLFTY
jgi:hypothetical protein